MHQANQWRVALGEEIGSVYAEEAKVTAVFLHGSTAYGSADRFSDIELAVCWSEPPSEDELAAIAVRAGGASWKLSSFAYSEALQASAEEYYVRGVKIDTGQWTTATLEQVLAEVVMNGDASLVKQNTVSVILHCIPFYGKEIIRSWQEKARNYPNTLAVAMVRDHLPSGSFGGQEMLAARNEIPLLYQNHCHRIRQILGILMGINRIYYPGHKWTQRLISEMPIVPTDLFARLERVFRSNAVAGTQELRALTLETLDLVEAHFPDMNVNARREEFISPYQSWDEMPGKGCRLIS
jgi:hypothetical protein